MAAMAGAAPSAAALAVVVGFVCAAVRSAVGLHLRTTASYLGASAHLALSATDGDVVWLLLDGPPAVEEHNSTDWAFTRRVARAWRDIERWRADQTVVRAFRWRRHLVLCEPQGACVVLVAKRDAPMHVRTAT